jgi:ATP-dependent NAD(P)H-hydrate dehydratase
LEVSDACGTSAILPLHTQGNSLYRHSGTLESKEISLLAAWAGCRIVRECAKRAFEKHGRAVLTSNLLEEIGPSYANLFEKGK